MHVLYYHRTLWADVNDDLIFDQALWSRERIGGHPQDSPWQYLVSRIMRKTHELLGNVTKSHCRSTSSLKSQAIKWGPDLIIGHNPGILGPLVELKSLLSIPVIWDAEDFHRGETDESSRISRKIQKLEDLCIPQLRTITAASPLIGKAYKSLYPSLVVQTINNAFPSSKGCRPIPNVDQPLALVWFSQILGLDRGLKEFLKCLKFLPETPLRITFIGAASNEIKSEIKRKSDI